MRSDIRCGQDGGAGRWVMGGGCGQSCYLLGAALVLRLPAWTMRPVRPCDMGVASGYTMAAGQPWGGLAIYWVLR